MRTFIIYKMVVEEVCAWRSVARNVETGVLTAVRSARLK